MRLLVAWREPERGPTITTIIAGIDCGPCGLGEECGVNASEYRRREGGGPVSLWDFRVLCSIVRDLGDALPGTAGSLRFNTGQAVVLLEVCLALRNKALRKSNPAVFLDRDGTITEDPGYLRDCSQVRLLPGAAEAIRSLRQAGFRIVVVTNQSGVARGYFTEIALAAIHRHLRQMLEAQGAVLDGIYYCPYHPEGVVDAYRKSSDWRKPQCGMLKAAAQDMGLDLSASWMVGNSVCDVEAGRRAGCKTVLVTRVSEEERSGRALAVGSGAPPSTRPSGVAPEAGAVPGAVTCRPDLVVGSLQEAGRRILEICSGSLRVARMDEP